MDQVDLDQIKKHRLEEQDRAWRVLLELRREALEPRQQPVKTLISSQSQNFSAYQDVQKLVGLPRDFLKEHDEMARKQTPTNNDPFFSGAPSSPFFSGGPKLQPILEEPPLSQPSYPPPPAQTAQNQIQALAQMDVETRMSSVMKGFKEGALKTAFDKLIDAMAGPLIEKIIPNIKGLGLNIELIEPAVRLAITFAFMLGIAELTAWIAPMAAKVMPGQTHEDMALKGQKLAEWMRKYAGEKAGVQVIEAALAVFPMIMLAFQDFSTADISGALNEPVQTPATQEEPA